MKINENLHIKQFNKIKRISNEDRIGIRYKGSGSFYLINLHPSGEPEASIGPPQTDY